jgi:hypothetical protein
MGPGGTTRSRIVWFVSRAIWSLAIALTLGQISFSVLNRSGDVAEESAPLMSIVFQYRFSTLGDRVGDPRGSRVVPPAREPDRLD